MNEEKLILIPSPLVLPFSYHFLRPKLAEKFQLFIPSLPQIALTYSRKLVWNETDYAHWLKAYMDEQGIEEAWLLGHSNSGAIAIRFAELYPSAVAGIIVADTIGVRKRNLLFTIGGRLIDAVIEWWLTLWGFWHLLWNLVFHAPNFLFQVYLATTADISQPARRVSCPVLILWGKLDHTIPLSFGHELKELIPHSQLYQSRKGSHDWIITRPSEAVDAIVKWVYHLRSSAKEGSHGRSISLENPGKESYLH